MIGRTIGHYRILERLGGGGMGVVYKAEDLTLGRFVALKFLPAELTCDADAKSRFLREARAASQLDHANICTIHDIGETDDEQTFIAMACYEGETLKARIERGATEVDEALKIAEQIGRGLAAAHEAGIVHRDVKPANVMLTAKGVAKILDFGLAKLAGATHITQSKTTLGTLAYMAPEQLKGEAVGPQADLWAFGVVLFELLTGQRPFRGDYAQAVSYSILNEQPASLLEIKPEAPAELERIVKKLLRKDPLQRYQTAEEVLTELEMLHKPGSGSGSGSGSGRAGGRVSKPREPLRAGARLGPYEIAEPLGSGGMGDVYRARDTRLDRQVAIKVLAPEFSDDVERRQRFQREAKTISSLSHPNICTLFDVGEQEGADYLVMEYLEGETLADRLTKGALPLNDLLKIGIQIGEALGAAHRQGVIHRDLKPGNVMLTKAGAVKLVDFGLAKDIDTVTAAPRHTHSPHLQSPDKPLTAEGAIIGTLAYMAPEQVEGREADARTDIFALGAILYEMATGERAFAATSKASLIAVIFSGEPRPESELRPETPSSLIRVIRRCLIKAPDERWESARDIAVQLRWIAAREPEERTGQGRRETRRWLFVVAGLFAAGLIALGLVVASNRSAMLGPAPLALALNSSNWSTTFGNAFALSPDGTMVAYVARNAAGRPQLAARNLRTGEDVLFAGTEEARFPFWSPDGKTLGFVYQFSIRAVALEGGPARTICDAKVWIEDTPTWSRSGTILFSRQREGVLLRVSDAGGAPVPATKLGPQEAQHLTPLFVSDDGFLMRVLMEEGAAKQRYGIYFARLGSAEKALVLPVAMGSFGVSGNSLMVATGPRMAVYPFDPERGAITGDVRTIELPVSVAKMSVTESGAVLLEEASGAGKRRLQWFDRLGRASGEVGEADYWMELELSPDGRRVAVAHGTGEKNRVVVHDLRRGAQTRIQGAGIFPVWSDDGSSIAYTTFVQAGTSVQSDVVMARADGSGELRPLLSSSEKETVYDIDRGRLLYTVDYEQLWIKDLAADSARPLTAVGGVVGRARFSPDGDWVLYDCSQSGQFEVYLQRVDGKGSRIQVSTNGGEDARWRRDGREAYYIDAMNRIVAVELSRRGESIEVGAATPLFDPPMQKFNTTYDVTSDGERFLVRTRAEDESMRIWYLVDWIGEER